VRQVDIIGRCPACGFDCNLRPDTSRYHRAHAAAHAVIRPGVDVSAIEKVAEMFEARERRLEDLDAACD
jgi:hypothetical protein